MKTLHMDRIRYGLPLFVLAIAVSLSFPQQIRAEDDEGLGLPIDIAADFTYSSLYYWRGAPGGTGSFAMPSVDISYSVSDVTVGANVWYAQGFEGDDTEASDNSEVDYTIYASATVGPVDLSAGAIDYTLPAGAPFADGHVLEVNVGAGVNTLPFDNSITLYVNVDGDDDDSLYLAPSVGYTYEEWAIGLTFGIVLGESPGYYGTDGTTLIDITPGVSYTIPFGEGEASVSLNLGYNPETGVKMPFFTFGTGFSL